MKTLYLLRHAKAEDAAENDFERRLSARGKTDAARMAGALKERGVRPGVVYCSSAPRARQTIEIMLPLMDVQMGKVCFDDALYLAAPDALAEFVVRIDDGYDSALICAHSPGLEDLAGFYLNHEAEKFPTCAFREIRFAAGCWAFAAPETFTETILLRPKELE
jgi:phosphohistidine phosphatase